MRPWATALLGALLLLGAPLLPHATAWSQDQAPAFSDEQLNQFVSIALVVADMVDGWDARITNAESEEQARTLADEAEAEITAYIESAEGLSAEDYRSILQQSRDDPALDARIREIWQARQPAE